MESGGHRRFDSEGFHEFLKDLGGETGVAIRDQLVRESKPSEQVGQKEVGGSQSGNLLFARNKNYSLTK